MTVIELKDEIKRVNLILKNNPTPHAYMQNRKYLDNLEKQYMFKTKGITK